MQASGEQLPFREQSFDVVFCDHGALSFCDPDIVVPECARLLRPGGLLAFCCTHPMLYLTWDDEREQQTRKLQIDYGRLGRMPLVEGTIDWVLPPGGWIRVLRAGGFEVEDLVELCARERRGDHLRGVRPSQVGAAVAGRVDLEGAAHRPDGRP